MIIFGSENNRKKLVTFGNGLLYKWNTAESYNFAPDGWHLPNTQEWQTLVDYLGGQTNAGGKLKSTRTGYVAGEPNWSSPNTGANNVSQFNALGSGFRSTDGSFNGIHNNTYWWTTTPNGLYYVVFYGLSYDSSSITSGSTWKTYGMPVRFISDTSRWYRGMIVTDVDGNIYNTLKVGDQVWIGSNWKCTKFNDGTPIPNVTSDEEWDSLSLTYAYCSYNNEPILEYTDMI